MTTCVPAAGGVPGLPDPPDWLSANPPNIHKDEVDDPRWRGSAAQGFPIPSGTDEHVQFRALYKTISATEKRLFLSWNVKVDPYVGPEDKLFVGFRDPASGTAMVVRITPYNPPDKVNQHVATISTVQRSGTSWAPLDPVPSWIDSTTRVWLTTTSSPTWAVQMVVPIKSGGTVTGDAGPTLTGDFGLWYYVLVYGGPAVGYLDGQFEWLPAPASPTLVGNILGGNYPDPTTWGTFHLSSGAADATCSTGGIALRYSDIGTTNTPPSQINYRVSGTPPINTFFARPRNYTPNAIPPGQIKARFRIANWGSIADPTASWIDIPNFGGLSNSLQIDPLPSGSDPTPPNPIARDWALTNAPAGSNDVDTFITGKDEHKCMLVELSGAGLTFLNNSTYRNMDFHALASILRRDAEISVVGLTPLSPAPRAVYLYVETRNMPAKVVTTEPPKTEPRRGEGVSIARSAAVDAVVTDEIPGPEPTFEQQVAGQPTYRVHVYHDTGERVTADGESRPVLKAQTSFGYFLSHSGAVAGWRHSLTAPPEAQLQEVAPNVYKIVVPNNGTMKVTTSIQAIEAGPIGLIGGCLAFPLNIILAILKAITRFFQKLRDLVTV